MGRIAGVTADETKARLLAAAADVFARSGYEGASVAEICAEAGLSSGAIYAHYGSKALLFGAVLQTFGAREFDRLLGGADLGGDVASLFTTLGVGLDRRGRPECSLLVEGIVAAKRDPEVAALLATAFGGRERFFADLVREGQREGSVAADVAPAAVARLALMLALGSLLIGALDLAPTDHDEWAALVTSMVNTYRADTAKETI
jgi:AcrR family transcriptional regulator